MNTKTMSIQVIHTGKRFILVTQAAAKLFSRIGSKFETSKVQPSTIWTVVAEIDTITSRAAKAPRGRALGSWPFKPRASVEAVSMHALGQTFSVLLSLGLRLTPHNRL